MGMSAELNENTQMSWRRGCVQNNQNVNIISTTGTVSPTEKQSEGKSCLQQSDILGVRLLTPYMRQQIWSQQ